MAQQTAYGRINIGFDNSSESILNQIAKQLKEEAKEWPNEYVRVLQRKAYQEARLERLKQETQDKTKADVLTSESRKVSSLEAGDYVCEIDMIKGAFGLVVKIAPTTSYGVLRYKFTLSNGLEYNLPGNHLVQVVTAWRTPKPVTPEQPKPIQLVDEFVLHCVKWVDTTLHVGWLKQEEIVERLKQPLTVTETVGYLVYEDKNIVALAQSVSGVAVDSMMVIPFGMITDIYKLGNPPKK